MYLLPRHGFRSNSSCLTNLLEGFNDWTLAYDHPEEVLDIVNTYFLKALDPVSHNRLLQKLNSFAKGDKMNSWLASFLFERAEQHVVLNGSFSKWTSVTSGVRLGATLGPLCFLVFINDFPNMVSSKIKLFANDCRLYRKIKIGLIVTECKKICIISRFGYRIGS